MADQILTAQVIANEAVMKLDNKLVHAKKVHRGYEEEYSKNVNGYKIGTKLEIRNPADFVVTDGRSLVKQDVIEGKTSITVDRQKHIGFNFTSADLTLEIEELSERVIEPAMIQLANKVDSDVASLAMKVPSWVGDPGNVIKDFEDFSAGPQRLDSLAVPADGRCMTMTPADYWKMTSTATNLLNNSLVGDAYKQGKLGMLGGVDTYMTQNVKSLTTGTRSGASIAINGTINSSTTSYEDVKDSMTQTINIDGLGGATQTIKEGEVFTIDGVYAVNPVTKEPLDFLREFVVLADATGVASATSLTIYPAMIWDGAHQNIATSVTNLNDQKLTFKGNPGAVIPQNMVFHKNAFALVSVPLVRPAGLHSSLVGRQTHNGTSVRVVPVYDGIEDDNAWRLDILYGIAAIDPRLATRISGTPAA